MKTSLADEWVEKAEADFRGAESLSRRREDPLSDLVCYHCQQCAEKYLKAFLIAQSATPPRIHDLAQLLNLCLLYDQSLASCLPLAQALNPYGTLIRYPGMSASVTEAKDALKATRELRRVLRESLGR